MTIYEEPPASDGKGGWHPLAGVPQEALDAATAALREGGHFNGDAHLEIYDDDIEPVAHAVLLAVVQTVERLKQEAARAESLVSAPADRVLCMSCGTTRSVEEPPCRCRVDRKDEVRRQANEHAIRREHSVTIDATGPTTVAMCAECPWSMSE